MQDRHLPPRPLFSKPESQANHRAEAYTRPCEVSTAAEPTATGSVAKSNTHFSSLLCTVRESRNGLHGALGPLLRASLGRNQDSSWDWELTGGSESSAKCTGCWQNAVSCRRRTEVPLLSLAAGRERLSSEATLRPLPCGPHQRQFTASLLAFSRPTGDAVSLPVPLTSRRAQSLFEGFT